MRLKIILPIIVIVVALSTFIVFKGISPKKDITPNPATGQVATPAPKKDTEKCQITLKTAFQSTTAMNEAPAGGQDVASNYWHVTFNDKTVVWQKADKLVAGTYTCNGTQIEAQINGETKTGTYDPATKNLVFDGQDYMISS